MKVIDLIGQILVSMELHLIATACLLFARIMITHQTTHSMCDSVFLSLLMMFRLAQCNLLAVM